MMQGQAPVWAHDLGALCAKQERGGLIATKQPSGSDDWCGRAIVKAMTAWSVNTQAES